MSTSFALDSQIDELALQALDASGTVIPSQAYDSPPVWTNDTPTVATLVASADGLGAVLTGVSAGTTNVGVTATVGGQNFATSLAVTVTSAGGIASIQIVATPAPKP